jgi:hypothetical protein
MTRDAGCRYGGDAAEPRSVTASLRHTPHRPRAMTLALLCAAGLSVLLPATASAQHASPDIRPLLRQYCASCHTAAGPGWSMADRDTVLARRHMIAAMVLQRMMPPWLAERGHQDYVGDLSLDDGVIDAFRRWRDAGFPLDEWSDPTMSEAEAEARATSPDPTTSREGNAHGGSHATPFVPDLTLDVLPGGSFLPNQERPDDYRCFIVDWTEPEPAYMTGFRASPGNLQVAHHVVVYAVGPGMADRFRELDTAEEGAGYRCFGGAVPDRLGRRAERQAYEARYPDGVRELSRGNFWLAHWAPGMDGHVFPAGTGIRLEPGSALVVQMHYYGGAAPGQRDAGSRIEFQTASSVERPAFHFSQTRGDWLAGERNGTMVIPPGEMATYEVTDPLEDLLPYIARVTGVPVERIGGLEVHSVNLHMHAFGHSGEVSLTDGRGRRETLLSIPRWDLRWQRDFTFAQPKVFTRAELEGVRLTVQCTYSNRTDQTVYGGYGSFDEMCFNFAYIAVEEVEVEVEVEAEVEAEAGPGAGAGG